MGQCIWPSGKEMFSVGDLNSFILNVCCYEPYKTCNQTGRPHLWLYNLPWPWLPWCWEKISRCSFFLFWPSESCAKSCYGIWLAAAKTSSTKILTVSVWFLLGVLHQWCFSVALVVSSYWLRLCLIAQYNSSGGLRPTMWMCRENEDLFMPVQRVYLLLQGIRTYIWHV